MEYFKNLPGDITLDILSRLPTESVLECKSVCKTWNRLVSHHPSFSRMHLHHLNHPSAAADDDSGKLGFIAWTYETARIDKFHYFEYHESATPPIQRIIRFNFTLPFMFSAFVSSCDGLICLSPLRYLGLVCICNTVTKEYLMLPEIKTDCFDLDHFGCTKTAFGYVSSTNEYKVLRIYVRINEFVEVHIYTLGSGNGWRNLGKFHFEFSPHHGEPGMFANGAFYWMGAQPGVILTFDLLEEKFIEFISPPPLTPYYYHHWRYNQIGILDRCLFFAVLEGAEAQFYEIWLLRKKNDIHGMKEQEQHQSWVWSREFKVDTNSDLLAITKGDGVLYYKSFKLNIYDTKASTSKTLVDLKERFRRVYPHRNTLISLKGLGEEDTKTMDSVEVKEI